MTPYPYCPNKRCSNHKPLPRARVWYIRKGYYQTKILGKQNRFMCKECGKTFSKRTFSIDYYTKRIIDYNRLLKEQITSSGIRDMTRDFNCTTDTIQNRILRLSHQIWGVLAVTLPDFVLIEDLAADGLESFIESQFFPTNINVLTGRNSQYIYDFNAFHFKRKGRMTDKQKEIKETLYKSAFFEQKGAKRSFMELLDTLNRLQKNSTLKTLTLDTDENPVYRSSLKSHIELSQAMKRKELLHRLTNSKEERNLQNKLFPCNYIDRQIRKDMAEHVRESVQFPRDMNNSMERFTLYSFWHNYMKPFRISHRDFKHMTHAEQAGIERKRVKLIISRVLSGQRVLYEFAEEGLTPFQKRSWMKMNPHPLKKKRMYLPQFLAA